MTITVYQIFEGGQRRALGHLREDVVYIGRESYEGGLEVDSSAVSRKHAVFIKVADHWFYKDLGSSNGSWLNANHISAGLPYLLRSKDKIQLADSVIELVGEKDDFLENPAVISFSRGDFLGLFDIPEVGKIVSIGGLKGDLKLDVDFDELPVVVLEKRSNFICAYPVSPGNKATLNDQPLTQLARIKDRDIISVNPYTLVVSVPGEASFDSSLPANSFKNEELKETFNSWEEERKPAARTPFGQLGAEESIGEEERTISSDMRPVGRFGGQSVSTPNTVQSIEEKIVFILGTTLVVIILTLVLWWILR